MATLLVACSSASGPVEPPVQEDSGFAIDRDAFSFENFAGGFEDSRLTPALMSRMFGAGRVCTGTGPTCALSRPAQAFLDNANAAMSGGRCEGFAVASSLFYLKALDPSTFGAPRVRDLTIQDSRPLREELAYWFSTQFVTAVAKPKRLFAKDVIPFFADALARPGEMYRIGMVRKSRNGLSGGHAVTVIGYAKTDVPGFYVLRVYDNNLPKKERRIVIDTVKNRWEFSASTNPADAAALYYGDDSNDNPLYVTPVRPRLGELPCGFCADAAANQIVARGANVAATDAAGNRTGIVGGEIVEGGGGVVSPAFTGAATAYDAAPVMISTAPGDVTLAIGARAVEEGEPPPTSGGADVRVFGAGFAASAEGLTPSVVSSDTLSVRGGGTDLALKNASGTAVTLRSAVTRDGGGSLEIEVQVPPGSSQVKASVDKDTGVVTASAEGKTDTAVSVTVSKVDGSGATQSGTVVVPAGASGTGTVSVTADTWKPGEPMPATQDKGDGAPPVPLQDACFDGVQDGKETDVDCGGACAAKCAVGLACAVDGDCASSACDGAAHLCTVAGCSDGKRDADETDVDCGGSCATKCAVGAGCASASDCATGACHATDKRCVTSTCANGAKDGQESDVDCGGSCATRCAVGAGCAGPADCTSGLCHATQHVCAATSCQDGATDGTESDVDCGGTCSVKCTVGQQCATNGDCASSACEAGTHVCVAELTCSNGKLDGTETDVDCGGTCSTKCAIDQQCGASGDCASGACHAVTHRCVASTCVDGALDGTESDLDCGGACSTKCAVGQQCAVAGDCASGACSATTHLCVAASTCVNGVLDGTETDIDCGGACSTKCAVGQQCLVNGDCASVACHATTNKCVASTCVDGKVDGTETDLDCGGTCSTKCALGQTCAVNGDCASGACHAITHQCVATTCADAKVDGTETDVDCGGTCAPAQRCAFGAACVGNGDCVTGKCSGGFCVDDPPPVTSGLAARYDARITSSFTINAGKVVQWQDLSGNGRDLGVATIGPVFGAPLGTGPSMDFAGGAGFQTAAFPLTTDVTVFAVVREGAWAAYGPIASHGDRDYDWALEHNGASAQVHFQSVDDNVNVNYTVAQGSSYLMVGRMQGTTRELTVVPEGGGPTTVSGTGNSSTVGSKVLHVGYSNNGEPYNGQIGALLYYARALSDPERDSVMTYLQTGWGL